MRAVLQRVLSASVTVDGKVVGTIGKGWLVLLGVASGDTSEDLDYIADKTMNLRAFPDDAGKMNLSVLDIQAEILAVSQFTLYGDCRKGRRPSFTEAAPPSEATKYYEQYIARLKAAGLRVEAGVFQAHMSVQLVNDGPVTMLLDSKRVL